MLNCVLFLFFVLFNKKMMLESYPWLIMKSFRAESSMEVVSRCLEMERVHLLGNCIVRI